jgi:hypothetical protein
VKLRDGRVVIDSGKVLGIRSDSLNVAALKRVVNDAQVVVLNTSSPIAIHFNEVTRKAEAIPWKGSGLAGATVPAELLTNKAQSFVGVDPTQTAREAAITTAHELYGHLDPYFAQKPYTHETAPYELFKTIEGEAGENHDNKP